MAWANTLTLIPLSQLAYHLQLDPWHFEGITSTTRRNAAACDDTWYQHDWQASGKLSRESLALALRQAEDVVTSYLNWSPVPKWESEEVQLPEYYKPEQFNLRNSRGLAKSVIASRCYVTEVGRKTSALIPPAGIATAFSSSGLAGALDDVVTVTFATTVTDEDELHIYYPDKNGRDVWEIRPVTSIDITLGTATIIFPKYLIPLEALVEQVPAPGDAHILINGDDNLDFLQTVDAYRVYADPAEQITFHYDLSNAGCSDPPCAVDDETGCLFIRNSKLGILSYRRADWDTDTLAYASKSFSYIPIKGTIYYRAGRTDSNVLYPNRQMDAALERMIVYYALSLLDTELCSCSNTRNIWEYMTEDLSLVTRDKSHVVQWDDLKNAFGTTRAAMNLWKYVQKIRISKSQNPR